MPLLVQDEHAASRLRRMKLTASALLAVAAGLYALSFAFSGTGAEFLRAGSEAAMVGGLADWFAVTALFRRPLGLPIPHTGLVPRKKDDLALKLGEFVTGHFLTREVVVEQVRHADVVGKVGRFALEDGVAERLASEVSFNAGALLEVLDEEAVVASALELLRKDAARRSYAPVLGRVLDRAIAGGTQRPLVDLVISRSLSYLRGHREELVPQARAFVDDGPWFAGLLFGDRQIRKFLDGVAAKIAEVDSDPRHPLRGWLDGLLRSVAYELQHDRQTAARLDVLMAQLIEDPQAQAVLHEVITDAVASVRASLADADGELQQRIADLLITLAQRAVSDPVFRARVEGVLEAVIGHAVENYGDELTLLIRQQVGKWDATSASQRIELAVGRDLQFIRINGTAVGALAGLTIHAVTVAL
jgi:uncharacterized membrane-anchored protein YjiN (DUF445 family)